MVIAESFREASNLIFINPYQVYAATLICTGTSKHRALLMGPGQGKTIVILLIAAYLATAQTNVKIVVLNEILKA